MGECQHPFWLNVRVARLRLKSGWTRQLRPPVLYCGALYLFDSRVLDVHLLIHVRSGLRCSCGAVHLLHILANIVVCGDDSVGCLWFAEVVFEKKSSWCIVGYIRTD